MYTFSVLMSFGAQGYCSVWRVPCLLRATGMLWTEMSSRWVSWRWRWGTLPATPPAMWPSLLRRPPPRLVLLQALTPPLVQTQTQTHTGIGTVAGTVAVLSPHHPLDHTSSVVTLSAKDPLDARIFPGAATETCAGRWRGWPSCPETLCSSRGMEDSPHWGESGTRIHFCRIYDMLWCCMWCCGHDIHDRYTIYTQYI